MVYRERPRTHHPPSGGGVLGPGSSAKFKEAVPKLKFLNSLIYYFPFHK
jgi:hypothetical protein